MSELPEFNRDPLEVLRQLRVLIADGDKAGVGQHCQPARVGLPHRPDAYNPHSDFMRCHRCLLLYTARIKEWNSAV